MEIDSVNSNLKIEQEKQGDTLVCKLAGRLDPNTSPELVTQLDIRGIKNIIVDMKNVEYVFSSGLRALLVLQKMLAPQEGTIKLVNVSDDIRNIFVYTGFESMLEQ